MTTVTIDEIEYDTDDFTEEEKTTLSEINYNNSLQNQLKYQVQGLETINNTLVEKLKKSLTTTGG